MIAYPIIFSANMVRALLDGRKTQTRRLAEKQVVTYPGCPASWGLGEHCGDGYTYIPTVWQKRYDKWQAGERPWLYVRETWAGEAYYDDMPPRDIPDDACCICYDADGAWSDWDEMTHAGRWRPSIYMPKWASRLSLRVTDMRMERLAEISEEDAIAEGSREPSLVPIIGACWSERDAFAKLWASLHGPGAWNENPEVVRIEFEVHAQNIERIA